METYGQMLRRLRQTQRLSLRKLEALPGVHVSYSLISHIEAGRETSTRDTAEQLDTALEAAGALVAAWEREHRPRRAPAPPSGVVQALEAVSDGGADLAAVADALAELIPHYAHMVTRSPDARDELADVRRYTSRLLPQARGTWPWPDLVAGTGWLSALSAVASSHSGDHAAALVWCTDAERRAHEIRHTELGGAAILIRSTIAHYQGQAATAASLAARGQTVAGLGTVAHARLAAQEMRARAVLGDAEGMAAARRRADTALAALPAGAARTGAFGIPDAEHAPYTATSLLAVGDHDQAAAITDGLLENLYATPEARATSNYPRTLLIRALADAGRGDAASAAGIGRMALEATPPVWSTIVLARNLGVALAEQRDVAEVADYHGALAAIGSDAGGALQLTA